jgi:hypothetical protein
MVVGWSVEFVAMRQMPEVVAVGYARASPGCAQLTPLADRHPWNLRRKPIYLASLPSQSPKVLCHDPHPHPPPHADPPHAHPNPPDVPGLDVPALVSLPCLRLPHTFASETALQWHERYHLPLGFV